MNDRFTSDELALAKTVDLCKVAQHLGYTVRKIGNYHTLKEMDSIRIYNNTNWYRWSRSNERGSNGGSQIDFLRVFKGMSVKEAVFWLLDFAGYSHGKGKPDQSMTVTHKPKQERKKFVLPPANMNNRRIVEYLTKERDLSEETVQYFISKGLLYESATHHNAVFLGKDENGVVKFASMRGTLDRYGKSFKCDVAGNDKNYGVNLYMPESDTVNVFEAAIDLMSYMDLYKPDNESYVALGMLTDYPLETFLSEHTDIHTIRFCLDNDDKGREAAMKLREKYYGMGYEVLVGGLPEQYKDYNEWLVSVKRSISVPTNEPTKSRDKPTIL